MASSARRTVLDFAALAQNTGLELDVACPTLDPLHVSAHR